MSNLKIMTQRRWDLIHKFEREYVAKEKLSYKQCLAIFNSLHQFARAVGALDKKWALLGFDTTIKIAQTLNSLK